MEEFVKEVEYKIKVEIEEVEKEFKEELDEKALVEEEY